MIVENKYLTKAIKKAGYVVMVKTCSRSDRTGRLEYVSPNASELGMNVELLNKGLKLTEDYIHPEDRQLVIQTVLAAIETKVDDYIHEYRMVGDDGRIYNVSNEICVTEIYNDTFTVEFYLRNTDKEAGRNKESEADVEFARSKESPEQTERKVSALDFGDRQNSKAYSIMNTFAKAAKLYSVLVDVDGKIVFPPTGPSTNIGDFYDLFEKPAYKEYYKYIKEYVTEHAAPTVLEREEGGIGKISAAPIKSGNILMGFWILGSYNEEETATLREICASQWEIAELISDSICQRDVIATEIAKSRGAGIKLRKELERQNILTAALSKTGSHLIDSVDGVIEETLRDAGGSLNVDKAFLYVVKSLYHRHDTLRCYWNATGGNPDETLIKELPEYMQAIEDEIRKNDFYIADAANMTERAKLALLRCGFKTLICAPIYRNDDIYGILFFADCRSARIWESDELRFLKSVSIIISRMLDDAEGKDNVRRVNKHLIETYNSFKSGVFIRDAYTGEVLFSNEAMNTLVGCDFVGKDSREIITDLRDRFDSMGGMRKPFITKDRVTNWKKYIEPLGGIMDISEIQMEWLNGEPASLLIVRKAKDF